MFEEVLEKLARYINRSLEPVIEQATREFPVVVLIGPRQSGKTTLLKHLFERDFGYVSLEPPDVCTAAQTDPRAFIEMFPPPVIFDEIQYAPMLLPYIKERVDARRAQSGQYLLTGSQNLLLMEQVTESLAGRTAILRLMPLTQRETLGDPHAVFPWESDKRALSRRAISYRDLWKSFLRGGYPELVADPSRDSFLWHSSYIQTYLERDVRSLRQVGDLTLFQNFIRALAARSAGLLSLTELARDLGIAINTAKAWLSVLEATFQVTVLRPYFANVGKRMVKTPKIFFNDVGTLCRLVGLRDPEHAAVGPMGGAIFETAVIAELVKSHLHRGEDAEIYFWRTSSGVEVDILIEANGKLIPIEVKLSATPRPRMAASIERLRNDLGKRVLPGYIVHPGDVRLPLGKGVVALPFADL